MGSMRRSDDTGLTLYVILRNASHEVVIQSTGSVESYNSEHWAAYVHAASEQGDTGYYYVATSSNLAAGVYWIEWKYQEGGSPAVSDLVRASGSAYWNGTDWWNVSNLPNDVATAVAEMSIDGVSFGTFGKVILATAAGRVIATDNLDGTETVTFYAQDGVTPVLQVIDSLATGEREETATIP